MQEYLYFKISMNKIAKKMRTMFPSHEKNVKKKFQKPNILRKKPRKTITKPNLLEAGESFDTKTLVNKKSITEMNLEGIKLKTSTAQDPSGLNLKSTVEANVVHVSDGIEVNAIKTDESKVLTNYDFSIVEDREPQNDGDNSNQTLVNIESFFNESAEEKYMLFDIDLDPGKQVETYVVIDNQSPVCSMSIEQIPDLSGSVPAPAVTSPVPTETTQEVSYSTTIQNLYSQFTQTVKYKCDVPDCKKEFRSEQKFKKHKNTHDKDGSIKTPRHVTIQCPVKKVEADGTEKCCGRVFLVRELLLQHLNEDHTLEEASYECEECGRRFFWALGLRAHGRAHCRARRDAGAGSLACGWPGCGRVFRQPCRLREHARAHTGDRPYPCNFPNCGWSFRSASKLVRHARRHTGERRHACSACGRAFLRREHLRDHLARHHAPHERVQQPCAQPGCEQTFSNMSTMYLHMKKVHKAKNEKTFTPTATSTETLYTLVPPAPDTNNMFMVSQTPEATSTSEVAPEASALQMAASPGSESEEEWRAARTHCTWPLARALGAGATGLLKDDDQVEQSEGSESNTYTVRSDLFLHGNVMINEDSEHMRAAPGDALGGELGLLDAHPTIDLMQEELMYADTAADESSFRIFLLSGEELT